MSNVIDRPGAEQRPKWFVRSVTVIGGLIGTVPAVLASLGIEIAPDTTAAAQGLLDQAVVVFDQVNELVGLGLVLWGRVRKGSGRPLTVLPDPGGALSCAPVAVAAALALLLGGCTLQQAEAGVSLGIEKKRQASDIEAKAVQHAPCIMTVGAFYRLADPQKQCAISVLCGGTCPQLGAPPAAVFNIGPPRSGE